MGGLESLGAYYAEVLEDDLSSLQHEDWIVLQSTCSGSLYNFQVMNSFPTAEFTFLLPRLPLAIVIITNQRLTQLTSRLVTCSS